MVQIRLAGRPDEKHITNLVKTMIGDNNPDQVASDVVQDLFENNKFLIFVVDNTLDILGFGVTKLEPFEGANGVAEIVWLGVQSQYRKQGLGALIVMHIEQHIVKQGIRKLYVKTNSDNVHAACFWIKQNYKFESRLLDFGGQRNDYYLFGKEIC